MNSFEKKRNALYDAAVKDAKENGYEIFEGRQLTPEEQRAQNQSFQETFDFIAELKAWQKESRKKTIWVRAMVA